MNLICVAILHILELSTLTNKYLTDSEPWKLYKSNQKDPQIMYIVSTALNAVYNITKMFQPIITKTAQKILSFIEEDDQSFKI